MQLTKNGAQLDQHPETCKRARLTEVSMADDGFADGFRLVFRGPAVAQEIQGFEGAIVFERHVCAMRVFIRSAKVVEKACYVVRLKHI